MKWNPAHYQNFWPGSRVGRRICASQHMKRKLASALVPSHTTTIREITPSPLSLSSCPPIRFLVPWSLFISLSKISSIYKTPSYAPFFVFLQFHKIQCLNFFVLLKNNVYVSLVKFSPSSQTVGEKSLPKQIPLSLPLCSAHSIFSINLSHILLFNSLSLFDPFLASLHISLQNPTSLLASALALFLRTQLAIRVYAVCEVHSLRSQNFHIVVLVVEISTLPVSSIRDFT